jgi:hypothetical protein
MRPVTDPTILAQLEGGNSSNTGLKPVTDPTLLAQLEGSNTRQPAASNPSLLPRIGADALAGLAQFGHGLINTPHNIANAISSSLGAKVPTYLPNYNYGQALGVNAPNLGDKLLQGAAQYAPYAVAAGPELLAQAGGGALYGLTQSDTPFKSAGEDAALNLVTGGLLKGGAKTFGSKNAQNAIGNRVLNRLDKASAQGAALSPQETAENLAANYSDVNGQPLKVDIGTVTNNPLLKGVYQGLKYVPFTGASKNVNLLNRALSDKGIANTQGQLEQAYIDNALNQTNLRGDTRNTAATLVDQLNGLNQQQQPFAQAVDKAPTYFNQLANGVNDRANITKELKNNVFDVYDKERKISSEKYSPINNSDLRLDKLGIDNLFPNYGSAANELLANRENMNNLFDQDSDLSAKLRNELDKAQGLLSNNKNYGVTLPEAVTRIQNLGQLASSANAQGRRYEGMLLNNLKEGLSTDLNSALVKSGNNDLADALADANEHYKNNVLPFYQNNEIRKAVTSQNYIPPKAKLAAALHDPNSQSILMQMPNNAQNAALYQLLTGGKGTSAGLSNMDAKAIGSAYAKLPVDTKTAIAQYNPQADQYFENLPSYMAKHQDIETAKAPITKQLSSLSDDLAQQLEKSSNAGNKNIQNLQSQLESLKQQRFGKTPEKSAAAEKAAKAAEGLGALALGYFSPYAAAMLPLTSLLGRTTAKALSNPDLVNAYINGTRLPVSQSPLLNGATQAIPSLTVPYFNTSGGQ